MITTTKIETILGTMIAGSVEDGICLLEFSDRKILNKEYEDLSKYFKTAIQEGEDDYLISLRKQLTEYFEGTLKNFTLPLITPGSDFQRSVWEELRKISYGTTRTYLQQSIALSKPSSVRGVANANGMNRIAIIIPCHRVIGTDGKLTGYGGGLNRKKWLLDHEKFFSGQPIDLTMF